MTDYEIILKLEALLSVQLEMVGKLNAAYYYKPCYSIDKDGNVVELAINNVFAVNVAAIFKLMQNFEKLNYLNLRNIGLFDLNLLQPFDRLKHLNISDNGIKDITPLRYLCSLEKLNISHNIISDISPLEECKLVLELEAQKNSISDIRPLQQLTQLKVLDISENEIIDISPLSGHHSLEELYLCSNHLENASPLSGLHNLTGLSLFETGIQKIYFLRNLDKLTHVYLGGNDLFDLSPLLELPCLEALYLGGIAKRRGSSLLTRYNFTKPVKDFSVVGQLHNLKVLDASGISLTDIGFVKNLKKLHTLFLNDNMISDITPLKELHNLTTVRLQSNRIRVLPSWITNFYTAITYADSDTLVKEINLFFNPLQTPPVNIVKGGKQAIADYFKQIEKEAGKIDYLFEIKLLVIGEGGTGKTTFTRKIQNVDAEAPAEKDTTFGIEVNKWNFSVDFPKIPGLGKANFHVNLWDFGGQKIYQGTHQMFFSDKSFYVLLADTREQKTDFSYWLNTVEQLAGDNSSLVIVLNKKFGHEQKFDETGFRNRFGKLIKEVIEIDLKNDKTKMLALQDSVMMSLKQIPGIGDPLPPSWVKIRQELGTIKENFISFDHFRSMCAAHNIAEQSMIYTVSNYFTKIGAFTHYIDNPVLHERIYLNSNWLVKTIYQVLDNETVNTKKGRLSEEDIKIIWANNELMYEVSKLTELMHKFGLMYHIPFSDEYVVPSHLPTETPYINWANEGDAGLLRFIYEFDKYMPQGIMSRLIVALHHHIRNHDIVWHRGLNIELNGAQAEIIESYGGSNRFEIRIAGLNKTELLAVIRERFADVLKPFSKLNYKQLVPCVCDECRASAEPAFHDYNLLQKFIEKKTGSQCSRSGEIVNPEELLKILSAKPLKQALDVGLKAKPKTIRVFLASSKEMEDDRKALREFFSVENDRLYEDGVYVKLIQWEHFIDAMSQDGLQSQYNEAVRGCDIFLSLFLIKVGKYTTAEFETAFGECKEIGKPLVYTYFKKPQVNADQYKKADFDAKYKFEKRLKDLGHYKTNYDDINHLKNLLREQLDKILPGIVGG